MHKWWIVMLFLMRVVGVYAQLMVKSGDRFPDYTLGPMVNAPVNELRVVQYTRKLLILNFWGTWCSPCLPEMDSLAVLQRRNAGVVQVVGVSSEGVDRLRKYLVRKPSTLWFVSDTTDYLYKAFALNYVGQSVIVDKQHNVVAVVRTDSINQAMIDRLVQGKPVWSSGETGDRRAGEKSGGDLFGVDSGTAYSVTFRGYAKGVGTMGKRYNGSVYEGRRMSWINVCPSILYKSAFDIQSEKQVVYAVSEKEACDFAHKNTLCCFDILVRPEQKDSLLVLAQQALNRLLDVKGRMEERVMPVYVLRVKVPGGITFPESKADTSVWGFSGEGFSGKKIVFKVFVDYLSNELALPVVDETGLTGKYDIVTQNELRTTEDVLAAIDKLGLVVVKAERAVGVLVLYKEK